MQLLQNAWTKDNVKNLQQKKFAKMQLTSKEWSGFKRNAQKHVAFVESDTTLIDDELRL